MREEVALKINLPESRVQVECLKMRKYHILTKENKNDNIRVRLNFTRVCRAYK